jgi:hypothetical protein
MTGPKKASDQESRSVHHAPISAAESTAAVDQDPPTPLDRERGDPDGPAAVRNELGAAEVQTSANAIAAVARAAARDEPNEAVLRDL